jgi:hypothetical protein
MLFAYLACYPCSDANTCSDEKKNGIEVTISNHEHSPREIDHCSPFCICTCCSSQINTPAYFHFEAFCPKFIEQQSILKTHLVKSIPHSIWQPPRLFQSGSENC